VVALDSENKRIWLGEGGSNSFRFFLFFFFLVLGIEPRAS
jgi:hypothetical protein